MFQPLANTVLQVQTPYPAYEQDYASLKAGIDTSIKHYSDTENGFKSPRNLDIMQLLDDIVLDVIEKTSEHIYVGGAYASYLYLLCSKRLNRRGHLDVRLVPEIYCTEISIIQPLLIALMAKITSVAEPVRLIPSAGGYKCYNENNKKLFVLKTLILHPISFVHCLACHTEDNISTTLFQPATGTWHHSHRFMEYLNSYQIILMETDKKVLPSYETIMVQFPHYGLTILGRKIE